MGSELVCLGNVIFELYKASLNGEIAQNEFFKVKEIVKRARVIEKEELKAMLNMEK